MQPDNLKWTTSDVLLALLVGGVLGTVVGLYAAMAKAIWNWVTS